MTRAEISPSASPGTVPAARESIRVPEAPSLARLAGVELRKMVDTRSGRWLLIVIAFSMVALIPLIYFAVPAGQRTPQEMHHVTQAGVSILLPVLGILLVTAEWSQRTTLTTFALVPVRERVIAAKLLAGVALAVTAATLGTLVGMAGQALGHAIGRADGGWLVGLSPYAGSVLFAVFMITIGVAFGMIFMNTPLAIVLYFLIPTIWSLLGESIKRLSGPMEWLDSNRALAPLAEKSLAEAHWGKIGTSLALWLALPLIAGAVRLARRELK